MTITAPDTLKTWFTTYWDVNVTFPFIEDENCNITGYGHQDCAAFAAEVNRYDEICNGEPFPEEEQWDADYISHRWAVMDPKDDERFWVRVPGTDDPVTESTPGAFPITTMWGHR